jgi:hypothetical protein
MGLYAISSTSTQLKVLFPRKEKYTAEVGEIDLSEDICAIRIQVKSFERTTLIKKFQDEEFTNKILEDSSFMLYSVPSSSEDSNKGFSFWIFAVAKISGVKDKIHESTRPKDAAEKDVWADVVALVGRRRDKRL